MINYFEYIDEYMEGTLSHDLKEDFEKELAVNAKLKHAVDNYYLIKNISGALIEDETRQTLASLDAKKSEKKNRTSGFKYMAVAASIVGLILVGSFFINKNQESRILALYKKPIYDGNRSMAADVISKRDSALLLFELNRWEESKKLFTALPQNDTTYYFLGHIGLQNKDYNNAILYLSQVPTDSPMHTDARYHLVMLYLLKKDKQKAKQIYQSISNDEARRSLGSFLK